MCCVVSFKNNIETGKGDPWNWAKNWNSHLICLHCTENIILAFWMLFIEKIYKIAILWGIQSRNICSVLSALGMESSRGLVWYKQIAAPPLMRQSTRGRATKLPEPSLLWIGFLAPQRVCLQVALGVFYAHAPPKAKQSNYSTGRQYIFNIYFEIHYSRFMTLKYFRLSYIWYSQKIESVIHVVVVIRCMSFWLWPHCICST